MNVDLIFAILQNAVGVIDILLFVTIASDIGSSKSHRRDDSRTFCQEYEIVLTQAALLCIGALPQSRQGSSGMWMKVMMR